MLLEIGVDLAGGNRRRCIFLARPRTDLWLTRGEVGDEAARFPHRSRDAAETRLVDAIARAHLRLLAGFELAQLGLEACRQHDQRRVLARRELSDFGRRFTTAGEQL